ncbi:MAG: hypothetical protein NZ898_08860 [Myxococcota bacterium]|nr:hypothetical protein [Myxococcota bacterium]MDW8360901.1 hypothetical protein [Myxococcales bacterium]
MRAPPEAIAGALAVALLVTWIAARAVLASRGRRGVPSERRAELDGLKARARAGTEPEARAAAWLEAARLAMQVRRPDLAASYALRARRAAPRSTEAIDALVRALRARRRYRALERLLWRALAEQDDAPVRTHLLEALVSLYEGPLRDRHRARALRRLASTH